MIQPSSKARVAATTRWPVSSVDNESFIAVTSRPRDDLKSLALRLSAFNSHGFMCCSSLRLCVGLVDYCHQDKGPKHDLFWRTEPELAAQNLAPTPPLPHPSIIGRGSFIRWGPVLTRDLVAQCVVVLCMDNLPRVMRRTKHCFTSVV